MRLALDLDGTLIDARRRQVEVARDALARLDAGPLDGELFWALKRAGANTEQALGKLGHPLPVATAAARLWRERIEADGWLACDRALAGTEAVLRSVRERGIAVLVLTARRRAEGAARSLEVAGLVDLVDELIVVDPSDAARGKAQVLREAEPLGFIGDTASDGQAAALAGVPFVAVATGQCSAECLHPLGCRVLPTLREGVAAALGSASAPVGA